MNDNPLDLPIPELSGDVNFEIRLRRSGSKLNKSTNTHTASVVLAIQNRLQSKQFSPYTLDCIDSVNKLFT